MYRAVRDVAGRLERVEGEKHIRKRIIAYQRVESLSALDRFVHHPDPRYTIGSHTEGVLEG